VFFCDHCGGPLCQSLTPRQGELLKLLAANPAATNRELALELSISETTVKKYFYQIYRLIGVQNRGECVALLVRAGGNEVAKAV